MPMATKVHVILQSHVALTWMPDITYFYSVSMDA